MLYPHRPETLNLDTSETKPNRSEAFPNDEASPEGLGVEEGRFGEVAACPNSKSQADGGISKILILMRHAKPDSSSSADDFDIPLSREGKEAQKKLCQKLGFCPKKVFASPFRRTMETGSIVAEHFQCDLVEEPALGEEFDEAKLMTIIDADIVAFVGHGPSLTDFANHLLGSTHFKGILPQSSAVILKIENNAVTLYDTIYSSSAPNAAPKV